MRFGKTACIIIVILVFMLFTGAWAEQENMLKNPDFEIINADGLPAEWVKNMWYFDGCSNLTASEDAYEGNYCLSVENMSENDARFEQTVIVEPETVYHLRCMIRVEGCSLLEDGAGLSIKDTFVSTETLHDTEGTWKQVDLYGMTGEDQTSLTVMARVGGYGSLNTGHAWFDNFSMEKLEEIPDGVTVYSFLTEGSSGNNSSGSNGSSDHEALSGSTTLSLSIACLYLVVCLFFLFLAKKSLLPDKNHTDSAKPIYFIVCTSAVIIRIVISCLVRGYNVDMNCFIGWANQAASKGLSGFYSPGMFCDYPPGYIILLWIVGKIASLLGASLDSPFGWFLIKFFPMLADLLCSLIVYNTLRKSAGEWAGIILGGLIALSPATIVDSAAWGQVDSVFITVLIIALLQVSHGRYWLGIPLYAVSVLLKPQALLFAPLGAVMLIVEIIESNKAWKFRMILRTLGYILLFLAVAIGISIPLIYDLPPELLPESIGAMPIPSILRPVAFLINQYSNTVGSPSYNCCSISCANLYALLGLDWVDLSEVPAISVFAWFMFAASFLLAIYLYVRGKDRGKIFICAAVLIALLYTFAPKMHERYILPVLPLLLLAYSFDQDIRLLIAFGIFSITSYLNIALVLEYEYLLYVDIPLISQILSIGNIIGASFLVWTGWEMCVSEHTISFTRIYRPEITKKQQDKAKNQTTVEESLFKTKDAKLNLKKLDWIFLAGLTILSAAIAFPNLGSTLAPQTHWKSTANDEQIEFDLGSEEDFTLTYYGGICSSTFLVQLSDNQEEWTEAYYADYSQGQIFRWLWYKPCKKENGKFVLIDGASYIQHARYVRIISERAGLDLCEIGFLDANGNILPVSSVSTIGGSAQYDPKTLLDEQDTIPPYPTYLNGMYFDEIYHGRTAYEHLQGEHAYEYTHPPLGKVLIMVGIKLFGMTPFGWRFMPTLFGVLMVPLMYLLCKQLFRRTSLALIGASLMQLDCMHFTQSRIATIDVFAVFFIMLMYLFMIRYAMMSFYHTRLFKTLIPLGLSGISMGFAISCKWIGVYGGIGLAIIFFFTIIQRFREYLYAKKHLDTIDADSRRIAQRATRIFGRATLHTILSCIIFFIIIPCLIYYFSYYWQLTPDGNFSIRGVWETQLSMYEYHTSITWNSHYFESPWYEWPLIIKPMWYYSGAAFMPYETVSSISCMGNPVVWWGGLLALIWVCARLCITSHNDRRYLFIAIGFLSEYLPWVLVPRCTFIYHYFASVPFIILSTVAVFEWVRKRNTKVYIISSSIYCGLALVLFIGFYPLMSGLPIPRSYAKYLRWFNWYNY